MYNSIRVGCASHTWLALSSCLSDFVKAGIVVFMFRVTASMTKSVTSLFYVEVQILFVFYKRQNIYVKE